jgi:hypothetical protein
MIPKQLHILNCNFNCFNIFDCFRDQIRVSEFPSIFTVIIFTVLKFFKLIEDVSESFNRFFSSCFVLEERSLSHLLSELNDLFFKIFDVLFIYSILLFDNWSDCLFYIFGIIFIFGPVCLDFTEFRWINNLEFWHVNSEHFNRFIKLIDFKISLVFICENFFIFFFDT